MARSKGSKDGSYIKHNCLVCNKEFTNHSNATKYCSRDCYHRSRRIEKYSKCLVCGKDILQRLPSGSSYRKKYCDRKCSAKRTGKTAKKSIEWRQKMSEANKRRIREGRHSWYIDGRTPVNKALRKSIDFKVWREAVFSRDNWTCQECNERGGELHPHHIKPFSTHPELRFDVNNGQTLCRKCHIKTESWGMNKKFLTN